MLFSLGLSVEGSASDSGFHNGSRRQNEINNHDYFLGGGVGWGTVSDTGLSTVSTTDVFIFEVLFVLKDF
jgi:hypothetical protein